MYRHNRKIDRSYKKPFFNRRQRGSGRLVVIAVLVLLIITIPAVILAQRSTLELATLEYFDIAPTPTPYAGERATLAEEAYRNGDIDTAALLYQQAVEQQPTNIAYMYEYGFVLIELNRNTEAREIGDRIIELAPNDPRGYALKANSIAWQNPTEAIPAAVEGRELNNNFAPLWASLSLSYTRIGRYTEALRAGSFAIELDPSNANARRNYSYPLIFTGNYSEAIRQLEQAIAINPNIVGPYFELASLYRNPAINQPEVSVAIYLEILNLEPNNERAYLRLCETYAAVGLFQEAEVYCDSALEIDPEYTSAHRMRGQLRYSRRNYEGAIQSFQMCYLLTVEEQLDIEIIDPLVIETQPNINIGLIEEQVNRNEVDMNALEIECIYVRGLAHYFLGDASNTNCESAWNWLNIALNHPQAVDSVQENILQGLSNTTVNCPGYSGRQLPTPMPPTPIPPTPIGG
ncbi:MAG: tetratricopeptide repeat protein [Anaerolineae bacterium]